jgi:hypothetical protein
MSGAPAVRHARRLVAVLAVVAAAVVGQAAPAGAVDPPTFTSEPADMVVPDGGSTSIGASAVGTSNSLEIMFQESVDGGDTWTTLGGCGGAPQLTCGMGPFTVHLDDDGTLYRAVATDEGGTTISRSALLTVVCTGDGCALADLTVTPDTDLLSNQEVTVAGEGFAPDASILLVTCRVESSACSLISPLSVVSDGDGAFTTPYSVPRLNLRNQDCLHLSGGCEVRAMMSGAIVGRAPVSFYPVQPDGQVKRQSDGVIFFDDQYATMPNQSPVQSRTHAIQPGGTWSYALRLQNDGPVTDDLTFTGPASPANNFQVRYFVGWFDVTAKVTSTGFTFQDVPVGTTKSIAVQFSALPGAGGNMTARMSFSSGIDPDARDVVSLNVYVP